MDILYNMQYKRQFRSTAPKASDNRRFPPSIDTFFSGQFEQRAERVEHVDVQRHFRVGCRSPRNVFQQLQLPRHRQVLVVIGAALTRPRLLGLRVVLDQFQALGEEPHPNVKQRPTGAQQGLKKVDPAESSEK